MAELTTETLELLLAAPPADPTLRTYRGTVTQTSPLRVQLDGDSAPLLATPDTVVFALFTGDRVLCLLAGRALVVVGRLTSVALAAMTKSTSGPAYSASTWTQVTGWDSPAEFANGITVDPAAGTVTIITAGRYNIHWRQRWQNYGTVYRRQAAVVLGTSEPTATATNVVAGNTSNHAGWYGGVADEPLVPLAAGNVLTMWVYSDTSSTYGGTNATPLPPVDRLVVARAL